MREHNRLCEQIVADNPSLSDELIYQHARSIVIGLMQQITFNEFLPALLTPTAIPQYYKYNDTVDPGIATEFSTAGYRLGHTMIPSQIQVGTNPANNVLIRNAYFQPSYVQTNGVDQLLLGATARIMNQIDGKVIDGLRNFLFESPSPTMMLDLVSLNIQRGRDHGLPGYNAVRRAYGLQTVSNFLGFNPDRKGGG